MSTLIGDFTIQPLAASRALDGETPRGVAASGVARVYRLTGPGHLELTIRDVRWDNRERDVVACVRHASPERFDTLIERLRLPVLESQGPYVDLRQARLRPNGRAGCSTRRRPNSTPGPVSPFSRRFASMEQLPSAQGRSCSGIVARHGSATPLGSGWGRTRSALWWHMSSLASAR